MTLKIQNSREKKRLAKELAEEYGTDESLFDGYDLLVCGGDAWIVSRAALEQDLTGLKVDSIGMQAIRAGKPTIHGLQILFKNAETTELPAEQAQAFIDGNPITASGKIMAYRNHPLDLAEEKDGCLRRRK